MGVSFMGPGLAPSRVCHPPRPTPPRPRVAMPCAARRRRARSIYGDRRSAPRGRPRRHDTAPVCAISAPRSPPRHRSAPAPSDATGRQRRGVQEKARRRARSTPGREASSAATPRYHSRPMTRDEIERKLIDIVRHEKSDIPDEKLTAATPLAEAGIDSLDALTILFAIEEEFHISVPDDRARAMKTFGDMIDIVEGLT